MAREDSDELFREEEDCHANSASQSGQVELSQLLPNLDFEPNPQLVNKGWERRFMADPKRAEEVTRLYRELGYEVRSEPIEPTELSAVCGDCRLATCLAYVTLYTRKRSS
jgi:hypothetical protein